MQRYEGYKFDIKQSLIGVQFLFVAFGALVLVPILTGLDANVALFTAGLGTLLFQIITRKNVPPIFLASSFAFIAPLQYGIEKWGIAVTMGGVIFAGFFYVVLSFYSSLWWREKFCIKFCLQLVVGPSHHDYRPHNLLQMPSKWPTSATEIYTQNEAMIVAATSLVATILVMMLGRGMLRLIPILLGIITGYTLAYAFGMVDFSPIANAPWLRMPNFTAPKFEPIAIIYMVPIAIAPAIEHIGDMLAISNVTKRF